MILTITLGSRLAGGPTLTEIAQFGRSLTQATLRRLGAFLDPRTGRYTAPRISTLHCVLKELDLEPLESLPGEWMKSQVPEPEAVAIDGKTMHGSYNHDLDEHDQPRRDSAQQQLSAVDLDTGVVVAQRGYTGRKEETEGAALRQILPSLDPGTVVIADALHTSRATGQLLCDLGLYYVLQVEGNQPKLLEVLEECDWREIQTRDVDGGHGRIETRSLMRMGIPQDVLEPWLDFPGACFAARITRDVEYKKDGRVRGQEISYILTNLPRPCASRKRLPEYTRCYWGAVENGLHFVRDVALGEDACRVRSGSFQG